MLSLKLANLHPCHSKIKLFRYANRRDVFSHPPKKRLIHACHFRYWLLIERVWQRRATSGRRIEGHRRIRHVHQRYRGEQRYNANNQGSRLSDQLLQTHARASQRGPSDRRHPQHLQRRRARRPRRGLPRHFLLPRFVFFFFLLCCKKNLHG